MPLRKKHDENDQTTDMKKKTEDEQSKFEELDLEKKFPEFKGWESIGFHRQLGNELWSVTLSLVQSGLVVLMLVFITPLTNPYPEIGGYAGIAGGLFGVVFTVFDTPTNFGVGQFIAENRVKNPDKMMQYIRFFIWWQMMSGLIQITGLSFMVLDVLVYSNYAHLTWLLLFTVQKQWPSMLGIFRACIDGFQHFDKSNIIGFFQGSVFGQIMNIGMVVLGRYVGMIYPGLGEILGMALFGAMSGYFNDIIFFFISATFFNKIVKPMGFSIRDAFRFRFDKDVVKRSLSYGIQSSIVPIFGGFSGTFMLVLMTQNITSYASWKSLVGIGMDITGLMGSFGNYSLQTTLAEAYPNGKKKLSEFYASYAMRWRLLFMMVFMVIVASIYPFFNVILKTIGGLEFWIPGLVFFFPGLIRRLWDPFIGLPDSTMLGTFHIRQWVIARVLEECLKMTLGYTFIVVLRIGDYGIPGITFLLVFDQIIPITIKTIGCTWYSHTRIFKIKIYWMCSVVIPLISSLPIFLLSYVWMQIVLPVLTSTLTLIPASIIVIIGALLSMFLGVFFPMMGILGGFDDYSLFVLHKAIQISGPSKGLLTMVEKLLVKCVGIGKKLRLHNRFGIPYQEAHKEIEELMQLKKEGKFIILKREAL